MKKLLIILSLSLIVLSCASYQNLITANPSLSYKVKNMTRHQIPLSKYQDILTYGKYKTMPKDKDHHYAFAYDSLTTQCFASKNGKIIIAKRFRDINFDYSFKIRYEDDKGTYFGHGYKFVGSDSMSLKSNWLYAIVSRNKSSISDKSNIRTCLFIESKYNEIVIIAERNMKKTALKLLDLFTMEMFDVKLHLKDFYHKPLEY